MSMSIESLEQLIKNGHTVYNRLWQKAQSDVEQVNVRLDKLEGKLETDITKLERKIDDNDSHTRERLGRIEDTISDHGKLMQEMSRQLAINGTILEQFNRDLSRLETLIEKIANSNQEQDGILNKWNGMLVIGAGLFAMVGAPVLVELINKMTGG